MGNTNVHPPKGKYALSGAIFNASQTPGFSTKVKALPEMTLATIKGTWGKHLNARMKLLSVIAIALYVISPIDILPEAVLLLPGLLDDLALSLYATATLLNLAENYTQDVNNITASEENFHHTKSDGSFQNSSEENSVYTIHTMGTARTS